MIADKRIIKVMIDVWTDSCPALVLQCLGAVAWGLARVLHVVLNLRPRLSGDVLPHI